MVYTTLKNSSSVNSEELCPKLINMVSAWDELAIHFNPLFLSLKWPISVNDSSDNGLYFWIVAAHKEWSSFCIICLDIQRPWDLPIFSWASFICFIIASHQIHWDYKSKPTLCLLNQTSRCCCSKYYVLLVFSLSFSCVFMYLQAVLGFVKVLVSTSQAQDLQNLLQNLLYEILPWSSVSRHYFKSKVIMRIVLDFSFRVISVLLLPQNG